MSVDYPDWICGPCGTELGRRESHWSTWHVGVCGWCDNGSRSVTEPRDFGYPPAPNSAGGRPVSPPLTDPDAPAVPPAGVSAPQGRSVETVRSRPSPENVHGR